MLNKSNLFHADDKSTQYSNLVRLKYPEKNNICKNLTYI